MYDTLSNAYLLEDTKPEHLIEMGATLPYNASYEPLLLQLKSMVQEPDMKNGLVMVERLKAFGKKMQL